MMATYSPWHGKALVLDDLYSDKIPIKDTPGLPQASFLRGSIRRFDKHVLLQPISPDAMLLGRDSAGPMMSASSTSRHLQVSTSSSKIIYLVIPILAIAYGMFMMHIFRVWVLRKCCRRDGGGEITRPTVLSEAGRKYNLSAQQRLQVLEKIFAPTTETVSEQDVLEAKRQQHKVKQLARKEVPDHIDTFPDRKDDDFEIPYYGEEFVVQQPRVIDCSCGLVGSNAIIATTAKVDVQPQAKVEEKVEQVIVRIEPDTSKSDVVSDRHNPPNDKIQSNLQTSSPRDVLSIDLGISNSMDSHDSKRSRPSGSLSALMAVGVTWLATIDTELDPMLPQPSTAAPSLSKALGGTTMKEFWSRYDDDEEVAPPAAAASGADDDDDSTDENVCPICLCGFAEGESVTKSARCVHVFHRQCLFEWLEKKDECPVCREAMVTDAELNQAASEVLGKTRMIKAVAAYNLQTQTARSTASSRHRPTTIRASSGDAPISSAVRPVYLTRFE